MNWYYEKAGQRQGPVPDAELDRLLASGEISATTLVWSEGMANWTALAQARPTSAGQATAPGEEPPPGWIRCTATGKYFPPSEIVYIDGKAYSAAAKPAVLQGVMQSGVVPTGLETDRVGPAWEQRAQLGIVKAGWETIKAVLMKPSETFATMKREGGLGAPLLFVVLFGSVTSVIALFYEYAFHLGITSLFPKIPGASAAASSQMTTGYFIGMAIFMPVLIVLIMFVGAGIQHIALMICGGAKQPFEATFRAYCYVQGSAYVFQIVPVCGAIVSGVWAIVCTCIGLAKTHDITIGRAVLAVLLPIIVCCGGAVLLVGALAAAGFAVGSAGR